MYLVNKLDRLLERDLFQILKENIFKETIMKSCDVGMWGFFLKYSILSLGIVSLQYYG